MATNSVQAPSPFETALRASSGEGSTGRSLMDHPLRGVRRRRGRAASLYAANSRTIIPLRVAAIVANALAMTYSGLHGTYPTFVLNAVLLPLNAWRLHGMRS